MTEVRIGYVADTADEVKSVVQAFGGDHVLLCNRLSVPRTVKDRAAEGLTDIYSIRGKRESTFAHEDHKFWELKLASHVCFCSICSTRDSHEQPCPYEALRDVRCITVDDKSNDDDWCKEQRAKQAVASYFRKKKVTGYINMNRLKDELHRIGRPFPSNAKQLDLTQIFLSMQETTAAEQEQLLEALEDEIANPAEPSLDDDPTNDTVSGNNQELPLSEEETPTDIDQLAMNDIEEDPTGEKDYNLSDEELKTMPDFSTLSSTVLDTLLVQRRLSTAGSRAEKEELLSNTIRPF